MNWIFFGLVLFFIAFFWFFFFCCRCVWKTANDFDTAIESCLSSLQRVNISIHRFSGMAHIGEICALNQPGAAPKEELFFDLTFDQAEMDRLHLKFRSFRVDLPLSHPLRGLTAGQPLVPVHWVISTEGKLLLRDEPTRFAGFFLLFWLWFWSFLLLLLCFFSFFASRFLFLSFSILTEAESLFVTNGSSAFVLHNGERLLSFASAAERDSAAASLNAVLWALLSASNSAARKMRMAQIQPAHLPGLVFCCHFLSAFLSYSLCPVFVCFIHAHSFSFSWSSHALERHPSNRRQHHFGDVCWLSWHARRCMLIMFLLLQQWERTRTTDFALHFSLLFDGVSCLAQQSQISTCPTLFANQVSPFYYQSSWGKTTWTATCTYTLHLDYPTTDYSSGTRDLVCNAALSFLPSLSFPSWSSFPLFVLFLLSLFCAFACLLRSLH